MKTVFLSLAAGSGSYPEGATDRSHRHSGSLLTISPDSRSGGLGEAGVATAPDVYAQYHNPAKCNFMSNPSAVSFSYTPYLSNIVNDIFFSYLTYYKQTSERSAVGGSLKYFSIGEVALTDLRGIRQYS